MRIYIATRVTNAPAANDLAAKLRFLGHRVVSRWHNTPEFLPPEAEMSRVERAAVCAANLEDLRRASAFVLLWMPENRGALFEAGVAEGIGAKVHVVAPKEDAPTLMLAHACWHPDVDTLLACLGRERAPRTIQLCVGDDASATAEYAYQVADLVHEWYGNLAVPGTWLELHLPPDAPPQVGFRMAVAATVATLELGEIDVRFVETTAPAEARLCWT